jgi:uncharacterized protein YecE (DUF72 family)
VECHRSWHCEEIFALLQAHRTAYCVMSGANLPCVLRATTDLIYLRMHGPDHHHLYSGSYPDTDLAWWADRIREWDLAGHDVFAYFNNDGNANAVRNARTLMLFVSGQCQPSGEVPGHLSQTRINSQSPDGDGGCLRTYDQGIWYANGRGTRSPGSAFSWAGHFR